MLILVRIHRVSIKQSHRLPVVNCFQNANFSEDSQALSLYSLLTIVVNCFQNANFSEDSQDPLVIMIQHLSCELLSEC